MVAVRYHRLALLLALLAAAPAAWAASLGISLGDEKHYMEHKQLFEPELRSTLALSAFFESIMTRGQWVNYRAAVGLNRYRDAGHKVNMDGYMMVHSVGFKLFQEQSMRLWIGPQLRLWYYNDFQRGEPGRYYKGAVWAASLGGTIGFHWYATPSFALGLNGGLWTGNYYGNYREYDQGGAVLRNIDAERSMIGSFQEFYLMVNF